MNISFSVKSTLSFKSSLSTSVGTLSNSFSTSHENSVSMAYLYAMDKMSTPGSSLWPNILMTWAKYFLGPSSFSNLTTTLWPGTQLFRLSLLVNVFFIVVQILIHFFIFYIYFYNHVIDFSFNYF